jgi:hypothetical protein
MTFEYRLYPIPAQEIPCSAIPAALAKIEQQTNVIIKQKPMNMKIKL